jgi:predicted transcriptional regulator
VDKTTLYLEAVDYRKLKRIAADKGRSPASLVREAIAEYVARHGHASLPASVGAFGSGRGDLGERAEELLDGFGKPAIPRNGRGSTRPARRTARPNARDRR